MTGQILIAPIAITVGALAIVTGLLLRRATRLERALEAHDRYEADLERILRKEGEGDE